MQSLGPMHPNALTACAGACRWLARETLVLEFMPRSWINEALYAESYGHGVNYWVELLVGCMLDQHAQRAAIPDQPAS